MQRTLTDSEMRSKSFFQRVASKPMQNTAIDEFQRQFHLLMQNPVEGVVHFENVDRGWLHNGNLGNLAAYYFAADGKHFFGAQIKRLAITGTCLRGYNRGRCDQMPDGIQYICSLIKKNPDISIIDLSNTQIGDEEAQMLLASLATNTKLQELKLTGNNISLSILEAIQGNLRKKVSQEEIIKNSRMLRQATSTPDNLLGALPKELLFFIATKTRDEECHIEEEARLIAARNFNKPILPRK